MVYGDVSMRVSSHIGDYLKRVYGYYWQTIAKTPYMDHETNESINSTYFNITSHPTLYGPATPFPSQFPLKPPFLNKTTLDDYKRKYISTFSLAENWSC